MRPASGNNSAFTLIELSIVLVIIGLIITAVLTGKDLIEQSRINNVVTHFREYNIAESTFHTKYGGMPGDLKNADLYGLNKNEQGEINAAATLRGNNNGNGDSFLQGIANNDTVHSIVYQGEVLNFWVHLSNSQVIKRHFEAQPANCRADTGNYCNAIPDVTFPATVIGKGFIAVTGSPEKNQKLYYVLGMDYNPRDVGADLVLTGTEGGKQGRSLTGDTLKPYQAWSIDKKLDDGKPDQGIVRVVGQYYNDSFHNLQYFLDDTTLSSSDCYAQVGGDYNLKIDDYVCTIRIQASVQ